MKKLFIFLVFTFNTYSFAAEEIRLWISVTGVQNIFNKVQKPFEEKTKIKITNIGDPKTGNSKQYLIDVIEGKAECATTALSFDNWVDLLKGDAKYGDKIAEIKPTLTHRTIGRDLMIVFVNPNNGKKKFTLEELGKVFSGEVTNWKDVGGKDLPIKIVVQTGKVATTKAFKDIVIKGKDYPSGFKAVETHEESVDYVQKTAGGIGFSPAGVTSGDLLADTPPIGRPLLLLCKGKPSANVQKLIQFISEEGPKLGVGK